MVICEPQRLLSCCSGWLGCHLARRLQDLGCQRLLKGMGRWLRRERLLG